MFAFVVVFVFRCVVCLVHDFVCVCVCVCVCVGGFFFFLTFQVHLILHFDDEPGVYCTVLRIAVGIFVFRTLKKISPKQQQQQQTVLGKAGIQRYSLHVKI